MEPLAAGSGELAGRKASFCGYRWDEASTVRVVNQMEPVLDGTVALVTGASSGIGTATAAALAAQGAAVALAARRRDRLEALAAEIKDQGGTALVLECDVTDQPQAADAVQRTVAELGRLDTLINNAGVMLLGPVVGAPLEEWQQMVELNVLGLLYCAHAALPHLLDAAANGPRQVADMVNISSVAGRAARNGNGVYSLTKHGVGAFSESLRQEVTKRYVRVSLVEPGATATELASHNRPEVLQSIRSQFGQTMRAEDIADAITYIVTRPRHVAVNEVLIRPTEQER
jgi:NADP-dependent 3-hydroxy acid dehydrogenase YdfG